MRLRVWKTCLLPLGLVGILLPVPQPGTRARAAEPRNADLEKIVLEAPAVVPPQEPNDVLERLRKQVARVVAEDRHDLIGARLWSTNNQVLWGHGRAVASLAQTMPYLPSDLAAKLRAYLAVEVDEYLLDARHIDKEVAGSVGTAEGVRFFGISWSNNGAFRWETLYGLWAYAHYTGDWARIKKNWPAIRSIYAKAEQTPRRALGTNADKGMGMVSGINSHIAGLMGMTRMAKRLKDPAIATAASKAAIARLKEKLAEIDSGPENPVVLLPNTWRELGMPAYVDLTPDLCRVLAAYRKGRVTMQMNLVVNRFRTWHLGDMDHVSDWMAAPPFPPVTADNKRPGEEGFQASVFASPIFLARAYIAGVSVETLRNELPMAQSSRTVPTYLDMFRLQNLVALAHRMSTVMWEAE
jgi:hypothetical protein